MTETGAVPEVAGRILTAQRRRPTCPPSTPPTPPSPPARRALLAARRIDVAPKQLVDLFTTFEVLATTDPDGYAAALKEKHPTLAQYSTEIEVVRDGFGGARGGASDVTAACSASG